MIGYTTLGVKDIEKAKTFYTELFADKGAKVQLDMGRIAMIGASMAEPMIAVCEPFNGEAPTSGNGTMVAFGADSKEQVAQMHEKTMALGGTCEDEPGQRVEDAFYGAYVRDLDNNKLCFYVFG